MNRIGLLWSRARAGTGAQAGERVLELARERGVAGADVRLHLLEGEVRIERDLVGAQRHRRVQLAPQGGERRGRRRGLVPLSLCRRHDAEQCDEARHLPRVEGAGIAVPATPIVSFRYTSTADTVLIAARSARLAGAGP